MIKAVHMLYFSPTGGTKKVVKEVGRTLGYPLQEHDMTLPAGRNEGIELEDNELLIVGVPVYAGRVPELAVEFLRKVKGKDTKAIFIVVYGNRAYEDALLELKQLLEGNGFKGIAAGAFVGEHSYTKQVGSGRPDEEDLEQAYRFGMEAKDLIHQLKNSSIIVNLSVNGKQPYREKMPLPPMAPETRENCTKCGLCAKVCPAEAIDRKDFTAVDGTKCIRCFACIKSCPVSAKVFRHEFVLKMTQSLIQNCSTVRKEPELFYIDA